MKLKRGGLYVADLNPRHGTESGKFRPVVVLQNDLLNETGHSSTWEIPCTTNLTPPNLLRVRLPKGCAGNEKECDVMIDQLRVIDNQRFRQCLSVIPRPLLNEIEEKVRVLGGL